MSSPALLSLSSLPSPLPTPDLITPSTLRKLSQAYPEVTAALTPKPRTPRPSMPLAKLDIFRYEELPQKIAKRKVDEGSRWLEKADLERLMEWKLQRGTYRPSLPGLIRANDPKLVKSATKKGLSEIDESDDPSPANSPSFPLQALHDVCALRGVGPATASLILSVACPVKLPFLSDELFAWIFGAKPAKYDEKEVVKLWEELQKLRRRLATDAKGTDEVENAEQHDLEKAETGSITTQMIERAAAVIQWLNAGRVEGWEASEKQPATKKNAKRSAPAKDGAAAKRKRG